MILRPLVTSDEPRNCTPETSIRLVFRGAGLSRYFRDLRPQTLDLQDAIHGAGRLIETRGPRPRSDARFWQNLVKPPNRLDFS